MKRNLVFFLIIFFPLISNGQNVNLILSKIPDNEIAAIHSLFCELFIEDHFAYTLFGDKPVSLSGNFKITPKRNLLNGFTTGGFFWNKWKIWEKYKNCFLIDKYILLDEPSEAYAGLHFVILINKELFIKTVKKNRHLFESILETSIEPEEVLKKIELKMMTFQRAIKNNELLWGLLLGYGKHNAQLYLKRENILKLKEKLKKTALIDKICFEKIEMKLNVLNQKLQPFGDHQYSPLILNSVCFVADENNLETIELKSKYNTLRGKISSIYAQHDLLKITLAQLTEKDSN